MRLGIFSIISPHRLFEYRLTFRFIGWFFFANAMVFWILGSRYLVSILSSDSLFDSSFALFTSWLGKTVIISFAVINYLSYMMLLAFIPTVLVGLFASVKPSKGLVMSLSVFVAALSVIFLILDTRVYSMFRFHINPTLLYLVFGLASYELFDFSRFELVIMVSTVLGVFVIEVIIARYIWKKISVNAHFKIGLSIAVGWFVGALLSYFTLMYSVGEGINLMSLQIPHLPLYTKLVTYVTPRKNAEEIWMRFSEQSRANPLFPNDANLRYPLHPMNCKAPSPSIQYYFDHG